MSLVIIWMRKYWINGFFGWNNCKWFIIEIRKTFSNEPSYFSSKRIERYLLFMGAFTSVMFYIWTHTKTLLYTEILALTGALFLYAGYTLNVTQKEKITDKKDENTNPDTPTN